jgi:hypothetical protein
MGFTKLSMHRAHINHDLFSLLSIGPLLPDEIAEIEEAGIKGGIPDSEYEFPWIK